MTPNDAGAYATRLILIRRHPSATTALNELVSCVISSLTVWDDGACHHQLWRSPMRIG